jgi:dTDP-4-amino-4,6-dideoxygalactose transaminase
MKTVPALLGNNATFAEKIPLTKPVLPEYQQFAQELETIFETGILTKGDHVRRLEESAAGLLGVGHAIAVSSCTAGLMLAYRALNLSGEVIVPSFTFMATVSALIWAGAEPVFVDVDAHTGTLDVSRVEAAITPRTSAIVAVHNFGNPADIDPLQAIAGRNGLNLVFDAAHGFGSTYQGRALGAQGDVQVFSLTPSKLVVAGEGGIVATNDRRVADAVRTGREYGNSGNYDSTFAGLNARMPEFNALIAQHSLHYLEAAVRHRNAVAAAYQNGLKHLPGISFQKVGESNRSSYNMFAINIAADQFGLTRDEFRTALAAENVDTRAYYDPPVHRQYAYKQFANPQVDLANTNRLAGTTVCLPIWSNMEMSIVSRICETIERTHVNADQIRPVLAEKKLAVA